jgi:hypothetical protein
MMRERTNAARLAACPGIADTPRPGQALIASVTDDGAPALLALVDLSDDPSPFSPKARWVPLADQARRAAVTALSAGWSAAPEVRCHRPPHPLLRCQTVSAHDAPCLDGPSFGLGFALAAASWVSQRPLRPGVVALATVDPSGRLGPVGHADVKARMFAHAGARILWLSAEQHETDVARAAEAAGLCVQRATTLSEVVAEALQPPAPPPPGWAERVVQWVELGQPRVVDYAPLARTLDGLLARPDTSHERLADLTRARRIVARHLDAPERPPWPVGVERLPRPVRLRRLAHVLQCHTDSGSRDPEQPVDALLSAALEYVAPPMERTACDLELLGAAGRLAAATGRLAAAEAWLQRAVEGWFAIERPAEACRPLCAWLQLRGLDDRDDRDVREGLSRLVRVLPDRDPGMPYLSLAAGRLAVQRGHDPSPLHAALQTDLPHVRDSARRWALRGGTAAQPPHTTSQWYALYLLDQPYDVARAEGMERLRRGWPERLAQVTSWRVRPGWSDLEQVREAWPY